MFLRRTIFCNVTIYLMGTVHVLVCCRTFVGLLKRCCRKSAYVLQNMKANYLVMLHAKLEVPRSNIMALRELTVTLQNLAPPPSTPYPSSCESVTFKAGLWPAKQKMELAFSREFSYSTLETIEHFGPLRIKITQKC